MNQPTELRLAASRPLATAALTLVTMATAISMSRVFADWNYLAPLMFAAIGTHVGCWALRATGWHPLIGLTVGVLVMAELLALAYYPLTTGIIPWRATWDATFADVRLIWQQFPTAVAPVPSRGNFSFGVGLAVTVTAFVADAFAFRLRGRAEAIVPSGILVVFTSALSAERHRVVVTALWAAAAVGAVIALRLSHRTTEVPWLGKRRLSAATTLPLALLTAGCVSVGAAAIAPRLPGAGEPALLDTRNRNGGSSEVVSPLVDIRSQLVNRSNAEMFAVEAESAHYWKIASLSVFDGSNWKPSTQSLSDTSDGIGGPQFGTVEYALSSQTFEINRLAGEWIPAASSPVEINRDNTFWSDVTQSLVAPDNPLERGDSYGVVSLVPRVTADQLRQATVSNAPDPDALQLPGNLPDIVNDLARDVTAGATTPYDKAIALQSWFQSEFVYDLDVQRGHNADSLSSFLQYRRGYCEHFAATFGAMARSLGIPTRVVVGFTPGELLNDGRYHVYGRQAHAWVEIWFDGIGWVNFDPTPGRGSPDDQDHTGVTPQQQIGPTTQGQQGTPSASPTVPQRRLPEDLPGVPTGQGAVPTTSVAARAVATSGGSGHAGLIVLALLALGGGWFVLAPRLATALRRRRTAAPIQRVAQSWTAAVAAVQRVGAPPIGGQTPHEYAGEAINLTGVDYRAMLQLADTVTTSVYSPADVDDTQARNAEQLTRTVRHWCFGSMPTHKRLWHRFLLR